METVTSKVFIIRSTHPLDMEGSPDVEAIFFDEEKANKECDLLNENSIAVTKLVWKERYQSFASTYKVEAWDVKDA